MPKRRTEFKFIERLQIKPVKAHPRDKVRSIGKSTVDGKWYGWSHRAYHGYRTRQAAVRFAESVA